MSKSPKKRTVASSATADPAAKPEEPAGDDAKSKKADSNSKQSRVIGMLQSPAGVTIAVMMKATGWQQHSVRGFLAGAVRKRLNLKLRSKKADGERVYQIVSGGGGNMPKNCFWNTRTSLCKASRMFATEVLCSARRYVVVTFEQHIFQKITAGDFLA
jgi:hypothetical protein